MPPMSSAITATQWGKNTPPRGTQCTAPQSCCSFWHNLAPATAGECYVTAVLWLAG